MGNMKKYSILFVATALLTSSCADWLDVTPTDKTRQEDLFATIEGIYSANSGLYREIVGANLYGRNLTQTTVDIMGHVMTYSSGTGAMGEPSAINGITRQNWALANFKYTDDTAKWHFASIWTSGYTMLLHINTYIKNLNESKVVMPAWEKNVLLGEAYGLRAYLHFDLMRLFGPVWKYKNANKILPYHDKTEVILNHSGYEETVYSTADEYMTKLLADIKTAEDLLKASDPIVSDMESISNHLRNDNFYQNRNRRMNYYAVKGLQARVLQYTGQSAEAAEAAKVITDQIADNGKRFRWPNRSMVVSNNNYIFFEEVVFGINNLGIDSQSETLYQTTELRNAYVVDARNLMSNILGVGEGSTIEAFADIRARQWVLAEIAAIEGTDFSREGTYRSNKYRKFSYRSDNTSVDYFPAIKDLQVLMRVSEMFYIQAEAALEAGDVTKAAELLNQVLINRGLTEQLLLTGAETEEQFKAHIEKEYYREFIGEGQIFFFHKRRVSPTMFKGYEAGSVEVRYPMTDYVVPIPESETNI
jgi:hypothetical protein